LKTRLFRFWRDSCCSGAVTRDARAAERETPMNRIVATALAAGLSLGAAEASANFVTNGGFETGDFTGWTQFGNTAATGVFADATLMPVGTFLAFFGPIGSTGGITQTVGAAPSAALTLSFALRDLSGGPPNFFDVSFNGASLLSITDSTPGPWTPSATT
jgi:hypothetical protein